MIECSDLAVMYSAWRERHAERDTRMAEMAAVVGGNFNSFDPDGEKVDSKSPNLIQVALEDTAESAALMPTIRVTPQNSNESSKKVAARMEKIGSNYLDTSFMDLGLIETLYDLVGFGLGVWVVWPDRDQKAPFIEKRDPRTCYYEPGLRTYDPARKVLFATSHFYSQLPAEWQLKMSEFAESGMSRVRAENLPVTIVEYFDEHEMVVAALWESSMYGTLSTTAGGVSYTPIELERWDHDYGVCPVVIGHRFSLDGEARGQFDQLVGVLEAHIRLQAMVLDYADQAVYSDVWVRDLIGELPYGGGSYIELGPNGAIGRVPPAVTSLNVQNDLANLADAIHLGGRWPKSRPGEVDQAIASAKFVEATAGVMNTVIKTLHGILRRMLERVLRVCFTVDQSHFGGRSKTVSGVLRNQEFLEDYDPRTDIDLKAKVKIEYGLGFGRDPAQSAVLHIQYKQNDFISKQTVQENIPGLLDVRKENARIDTERLEAMLFSKLLMKLEAGEVPDSALLDLMEAREKGTDLSSIYRKYVVEPAEAQQASLLNPGFGGPLAPGLPPGATGGPMGPDGMPAGGGHPAGPGPGGPQAPSAPEGSELLSRLNIPAGPGGLIGAQVAQ